MNLTFYFIVITVISYGTNAKLNKRQDKLVYEDKGVFAPMITDEVGNPVETANAEESIREVVLPPRSQPVPDDDDDFIDEEPCRLDHHRQCPSGRLQPPPRPELCPCIPDT